MTKLTDLDPTSIGPYLIVDRIGSGASGVVYKATDSSGRVVALKVIRQEIADLPQVRQRLAREADALQKVSGSRTVRVIEVNTTSERPYLAMEFVPGESLEEYIVEKGPMKGSNLWGLLEALIDALESLQQAGVVHRDLKPSNVLIGPDGIKLVDFGISSIGESSGLTETGVVLGTASWLSPEQISGGLVGSASDVFNLGLIVAYAATGQHPFGEGRSDALMYRVVHSEPDLSGLSSSISQIVAGCLMRNPDERLTLQALSSALLGMSSGDQDSESFADHISNAIPATRVVTPSFSFVGGANDVDSSSDSNLDSKKSKWFLKKKWMIAGAAVLSLAIVGAVVVSVASKNRGDDERAAYETQFENVLDAVETLKTSNTKYMDDTNELESIFFGFDWKKNGYSSFTDYVEQAGSRFWVEEYAKVYTTFYNSANPELSKLRALAMPDINKKTDLISIKNAFTDHYDTWLDFAGLYSDALNRYTAFFDKSWNNTVLEFHGRLNSQISQTFRKACNLLGDLQPVGGEIDHSSRITKICQD